MARQSGRTAAAMHAGGHAFYQAANGVWLTDHVPPRLPVRLARLGQDLDVPVRSPHAAPHARPFTADGAVSVVPSRLAASM